MQTQIVYIDGATLTVQKLDDIIRNNKKIQLTEEAWKKVTKSRQTIDNMISDPNKVVYGITTGFGSFADVSISPEQRHQLQVNLVRSHATGVGQPISNDTVRRVLILRINTLSKGRSGITVKNMERMIAACNKNFCPKIPCQGTVGASGDLAPLAHLALGLMGEGQAYDYESNSFKPSSEVMAKLNLDSIYLVEKQGLALINGTQFMTATISKVAAQVMNILQSSVVLYSFALEIFGADHRLFTEQTQQFYGQFNKELAEVIKQVRNLIGDQPSQMYKKRAVQEEVHSILDYPQALASIIKNLKSTIRIIEEEMNSATDNPLVYYKQEGVEEDQLISAGNFHGEYVAKASDFLGFALFTLGKFSQARIQKYVNGKISRLPAYLIKNGGLNSGLMIAQYTTAGLLSESKVLVKPASVDSIVTSAGQEDHVSMGGFAARKCEMLLHNMTHILGIELLMCACSTTILADLRPAQRLATIIDKVHKTMPPLQEDRFFGPDIQEATRLVSNNLQLI